MSYRKIVRWFRNHTCRHPRPYVKASTVVEPAPYPNRGNGTVGVTIRCRDCDLVWCADVIAGVALDRFATSREFAQALDICDPSPRASQGDRRG